MLHDNLRYPNPHGSRRIEVWRKPTLGSCHAPPNTSLHWMPCFLQFLQFLVITQNNASQERLATLRKSSAVWRYTQVHWQFICFHYRSLSMPEIIRKLTPNLGNHKLLYYYICSIFTILMITEWFALSLMSCISVKWVKLGLGYFEWMKTRMYWKKGLQSMRLHEDKGCELLIALV